LPDVLSLQHILKSVSRSFYLSLRILPKTVQQQVSLAYLFCRAADTIVDTPAFPRCQRRTLLQVFRKQFLIDCPSPSDLAQFQHALLPRQVRPAEQQLFQALPLCFGVFQELSTVDSQLIRQLVLALTHGMEMDLAYFPGDTLATVQALPDMATLELYTYYVAGVVGEFWTKIHSVHTPSWKADALEEHITLGIRFGKGLQLTNVLKDIGSDLLRGRCYIPQEKLDIYNIKIEEMDYMVNLSYLQPLILSLVQKALEDLDWACQYVMRLPSTAFCLRLACMWPLLFALQTLVLVCRADVVLSPISAVKISRRAVYRTMLFSGACLVLPRTFLHYYAVLRQDLLRTLDACTEGRR